VPTTSARQPERFPTTDWSLVRRAGETESSSHHVDLTRLLTLYLPALRAHLTQARGIRADHADDLLQGFTARKLLEQNLAAQADRTRAKFRTFLLTVLDHYVISESRRASAKKRVAERSMCLDPARLGARPANGPLPSDVFDVTWARQVLSETLRRMEAECRSDGRMDLWGVFECRILTPTLEGSAAPSYAELLDRFGFESPVQASNALVTGKRLFLRTLRSVVGEYAGASDEVEEEIHELRAILSRSRAGFR